MKKVSIMIVDDEELDRYILKRQLSKSDIAGEVFEADNGQSALDFLKDYKSNVEKYPDSYPPLIMFLDINMHIMGGFEFLEHFSRLREEHPAYSTCVFTMFTSSERQEDIDKAMAYDFVKGYISKSTFTLEDFTKIIDEHFGDYL